MKASLRRLMTSSGEAVRWLTLTLGAGGTLLGVIGCSTTSVLSPSAPPNEMALPAYAYLPHPAGYTISDIKLVLAEKSAPSPEVLTKCQDDFHKLYDRAVSTAEREQGVRELVSRNPAAYHWCFYSTIIGLQDGLAKDDFVDEKQKRIVKTYEYLVPVARAFMHEFQDSRYLRWAIRDYRRLADLYFYRKVELSPQMSSELVNVEVPPGESNEKLFQDTRKVSVIDKYKIEDSLPQIAVTGKENSEDQPKSSPTPAVAKAVAPVAPPSSAPASGNAYPAADKSVVDTMEYAKELARERQKAASPNRAPASAPAPAPANAPAPAPASAPAPLSAPATDATAETPPPVISEPPAESSSPVQKDKNDAQIFE